MAQSARNVIYVNRVPALYQLSTCICSHSETDASNDHLLSPDEAKTLCDAGCDPNNICLRTTRKAICATAALCKLPSCLQLHVDFWSISRLVDRCCFQSLAVTPVLLCRAPSSKVTGLLLIRLLTAARITGRTRLRSMLSVELLSEFYNYLPLACNF